MKSIKRVRKITIADKQLLAELKEIILGRVPDAELVLYGSAARGTREPDSDYDVLVLLKDPLSTEEQDAIGYAIYDLELARGVVISEVFVSRGEWEHGLIAASPFRRNVESEAIRF